jgi:hypothetical protein
MKITIEHPLEGTVIIDRPDFVDGDINDLRDKILIPALAGMTYQEHSIGVLFNIPEMMDDKYDYDTATWDASFFYASCDLEEQEEEEKPKKTKSKTKKNNKKKGATKK